jgi:rfaE bifunctional protein nucleotidyltransferase chain/domain
MTCRTVTKCLALPNLLPRLAELRAAGRTIVFTNGCFDLLHVGHVHLFAQAKAEGDVLVVAINSDASIRGLGKGGDRPIRSEVERAELLSAFRDIDFVTIFDEPTPAEIIDAVQPDVLVKGGDWGPGQIVGAEAVEARGGRVVRVPLVAGRSTTNLVDRIKATPGK